LDPKTKSIGEAPGWIDRYDKHPAVSRERYPQCERGRGCGFPHASRTTDKHEVVVGQQRGEISVCHDSS
jgi:hypothetical protein